MVIVMTASLPPGLYIVATPIGNLNDLSPRAADMLSRADIIACEDSRVTAKLLQHIGISKRMVAYHDHSDAARREELLAAMHDKAVALVSDAGTPLISDPGYKLVRAAREAGVAITTAPGATAAVAALTLSGLPTDRFLFAGFLPPKQVARRRALEELVGLRATLVFYESAPRLAKSLADMAAVLGGREAAVAREISKRFEEVRAGALDELAGHYAEQSVKGEIVICIGPPAEQAEPADADAVDDALRAALETLPPAKAARDVARRFGLDRGDVYRRVMAMKQD